MSGQGQPIDPVAALAQGQGAAMPDPVAALAAGQLPPPAPGTPPAPSSSADWRQQLLASPVGRLEHGIMDTVYGGLQLGGHIGSGLASAGGLAPNPVSRYIDQATADMDARRKLQDATQQQAIRATGGDPDGFDAGRLIGNVVSPTNMLGPEIGVGTQVATQFPRAARLANALMQSGYYGAQQPVDDNGNFAAEKIKQGEESVGLGGLLHGAGNVVGRVISPEIRQRAAQLLQAGVPLTAGQILGGTAQRLEDAATSIPVVGDIIRNRQREAIGGLRDAAINRSLGYIGDQLPGGQAGRDPINYAVNSISNSYNQLFPRMTGRLDQQLSLDNAQVARDALARGARPETIDRFVNIMRGEIGERAQNGVLTGDAIHDAWQNLGETQRQLSRSGNADDQTLARMIDDAQENFGNMLQRHNPQFADDLANTNRAFANFVRVRRAAGTVGAREGEFSPAQFASAVRASDASPGHSQYARGTALMQDLSDAGLAVLPSTVPDSGTPFRHAVQAGLALAGAGMGGEKAGIPGTEGAAMGAAALGSLAALGGTRMGQALIRHAITTRPANAPAVAAGVQTLAPRLTPALLAAMLKNPGNNAPE